MNLMPPPAGGPGPGRRKAVPLAKGKGLMDWVKLAESATDLSGTGGRLRSVTEAQLAAHAAPDDCWLLLNGLVYNVTPYVEYHPGGLDEILRGVGTDATSLFNEVHPWVNYQSMLKKCLIGRFVGGGNSVKGGGSSSASVSDEVKSRLNGLKMTWSSTGDGVVLSLSAPWLSESTLSAESPFPSQLRLVLRPRRRAPLRITWELPEKMKTDSLGVSGSGEERRIAFRAPSSPAFHKLQPSSVRLDAKPEWRRMEVSAVERLSQDTLLVHLRPLTNTYFRVPIGQHVYLQKSVKGSKISRPYTPVLATFPGVEQADSGDLHFLIKIYPKGLLTPVLAKLDLGDEVEVSDPEGSFDLRKLDGRRSLVLLAAGTGFTPCHRLATAWLRTHPPSMLCLVLFNKRTEDIPWREELDASGIRLHHVLSEPNAAWNGLRGRISRELLERVLPADRGQTFFAYCGPTQFTAQAASILTQLGVKDADAHAFT